MRYTTLKLGEILVKDGVMDEKTLQEALKSQKGSGKRVGEILIENKFITEEQLINSLSSQLGIEYIDLEAVKIDPSLSKYVPESIARTGHVVPVQKEDRILKLAMADPLDYNTISDIGAYSKLTVRVAISKQSEIEKKIHQIYASHKAIEAAQELSKLVEAIPKETDSYQNADQPIVRLVNMMIEQAVLMKASDIHIEPGEKKVRIRFRIDGYLVPYLEADTGIAPAVVSRIKFMGGMNIAEKRLPQDGRINIKIRGQEIDMRISSIPSIFGEKIVIRIATALDLNLDRSEIGFLSENIARFDQMLSKDHGIILITGPTGSGKSTTLYTILREKKRDDINLITVENPVETIIPGITQVDINTKAGLNFATILRSILRQDPDIIMVGEIRDEETADLSIGAAITGHLVFSTLHTFDAPSAVIRLVDMGIEPFMVSAALVGVISQRLIRKICPRCKVSYEPSVEELDRLNLNHKELGKQREKILLYKGAGCEYCNQTGYKGRTAIHEIMPITPKLRKGIYDGASIDDVRKIAIEEGMITLYENLRIRVLEGTTTYEELLKLYSSQI
ncbi:MAG: ATPase, T2SS/T4P/T4SS family [Eubacteriales bacterium]|nr:ATPase, T2SS/T4P/T4SS family [Eubacteriales bacterium]MDD4583290.1 ATPase, T2SS/T4P/T4SS family [Eubacteriales bacterium]